MIFTAERRRFFWQVLAFPHLFLTMIFIFSGCSHFALCSLHYVPLINGKDAENFTRRCEWINKISGTPPCRPSLAIACDALIVGILLALNSKFVFCTHLFWLRTRHRRSGNERFVTATCLFPCSVAVTDAFRDKFWFIGRIDVHSFLFPRLIRRLKLSSRWYIIY